MGKSLKERMIIIKGAGELATGVACRLYRANFRRILMLEISSPLAVRRQVSFCEAIHEQNMTVEGLTAVKVTTIDDLQEAWNSGKIAVRIDPQGESIPNCLPDVVIDATLAKRNLGLSISDAPQVIALGPGFVAGKDCHVVVETNRGHDLGRLITVGKAEADSGIPGYIGGYTKERVLRSPENGVFSADRKIGSRVHMGDVIGQVGGSPVTASIDGILRGLIRSGSHVSLGLKIGDIDPRGERTYCDTISEKARALGGAVLEAVLATYNQ